jgi:biotin synthase-related radical SAM superfamily protein
LQGSNKHNSLFLLFIGRNHMNPTVDQRTTRKPPKFVRLSSGSAAALKLREERLDTKPSTIYMMTYSSQKCTANCSYCPQARESRSSTSMLSRVSWPVFHTNDVLEAIGKSSGNAQMKRICIQTLNYPGALLDVISIVRTIRDACELPISVSCQPFDVQDIQQLAAAGVQRLGIPLDGATESIFDKVKGLQVGGPYRWEREVKLLEQAVVLFGNGNVSTHLIFGLGENEQEMIRIIQDCTDMSVLPALFAFTPIKGTKMENVPQPSIQEYRRIQIARFLIWHKLSRCDRMQFDDRGRLTDFGVTDVLLSRIVEDGEVFLTSGCPDCNRPYYNERPSGPFYNYPRRLKTQDLLEIERQLILK